MQNLTLTYNSNPHKNPDLRIVGFQGRSDTSGCQFFARIALLVPSTNRILIMNTFNGYLRENHLDIQWDNILTHCMQHFFTNFEYFLVDIGIGTQRSKELCTMNIQYSLQYYYVNMVFGSLKCDEILQHLDLKNLNFNYNALFAINIFSWL